MTEESPSRQAALFLQLVLGLQQSGMMALGKLMNPISRKVERHLDAARDTIDTLSALEARTRGNLEPDEEARTHDFILQNHPVFFVDDAAKMCAFTCASLNGQLDQWLADNEETAQILKDMEKQVDSALATPYWSVLPYSLGPQIEATPGVKKREVEP